MTEEEALKLCQKIKESEKDEISFLSLSLPKIEKYIAHFYDENSHFNKKFIDELGEEFIIENFKSLLIIEKILEEVKSNGEILKYKKLSPLYINKLIRENRFTILDRFIESNKDLKFKRPISSIGHPNFNNIDSELLAVIDKYELSLNKNWFELEKIEIFLKESLYYQKYYKIILRVMGKYIEHDEINALKFYDDNFSSFQILFSAADLINKNIERRNKVVDVKNLLKKINTLKKVKRTERLGELLEKIEAIDEKNKYLEIYKKNNYQHDVKLKVEMKVDQEEENLYHAIINDLFVGKVDINKCYEIFVYFIENNRSLYGKKLAERMVESADENNDLILSYSCLCYALKSLDRMDLLNETVDRVLSILPLKSDEKRSFEKMKTQATEDNF